MRIIKNMNEDRLMRDLVLEWVKKDEKHVVLAALVGRRISASMADQLVRGKYPQEPRGAIRTIIEEELTKAGILPEAAG